MNFKISDKDGLNYSLESGDNNKIHLDELTGYNSMFGEKICHGCLVILKTFKILDVKKILKDHGEYSINITFSKHFSYNKKISILKKNKNFKLIQNNHELAEITIQNKNNLKIFPCIKKYTLKLSKNILNNSNYKINLGILSLLLNNLTKYVGTIYPGKHSTINNININFNKKFKFDDNKIKFFSKKIDKRYSFINNKLTHKNYLIEFQTSERPKLLLNKNVISSSVKKLIKKIDETILIIGASSGIGLELLNIFKKNNKISIIATYNKNNILTNTSNVNSIKLDLEKNFLILKKILKTHQSIRIYYFATPKINVDTKDNQILKTYENFYVRYPLKILSLVKNKKIKFFYPSTIFIKKNSSNYSKMKKIGERMILKNTNINHKICTLRIDMVNTKQNLSFFNQNLPSFTQLLNKNIEYQKKIFFID